MIPWPYFALLAFLVVLDWAALWLMWGRCRDLEATNARQAVQLADLRTAAVMQGVVVDARYHPGGQE